MDKSAEGKLLRQIDKVEGCHAVFQAMRVIENFRALKDDELAAMVNCAIDADLTYMQQAGIDEGKAYDEDAAFSEITRALRRAYANDALSIDDFVEDYMEAWEVYLDSIGLIEWE